MGMEEHALLEDAPREGMAQRVVAHRVGDQVNRLLAELLALQLGQEVPQLEESARDRQARGARVVAVAEVGDEGDHLRVRGPGEDQDQGFALLDPVLVFQLRRPLQGDLDIRGIAVNQADDIDLVVPHQANVRIVEASCKRLGIPYEKTSMVIHRTGNTSSASIPLALEDAWAGGRVSQGDNILLVGFGAGMTSAAAVITWDGI